MSTTQSTQPTHYATQLHAYANLHDLESVEYTPCGTGIVCGSWVLDTHTQEWETEYESVYTLRALRNLLGY